MRPLTNTALWFALWVATIFFTGAILSRTAEARNDHPQTSPCYSIEDQSYGFVRCRYNDTKREWVLVYKPMAHGQVLASGRYPDMLRMLCDHRGSRIREIVQEIFSRWERRTKCSDVR